MRPTGSAPVVMPPGTLEIRQAVALQSHYWQRRREVIAPTVMPPGTLGRTPACAAPESLLAETSGGTPRCSSNSHATRDTGRYTRLCSSRVIIGKISRWNARGGGSSASVPPAIAHDFAGGVTNVVETQTAGLGPYGPTPEAVSAEATCGAILLWKTVLYAVIGQIEVALLK
jgi:hypothetical protein